MVQPSNGIQNHKSKNDFKFNLILISECQFFVFLTLVSFFEFLTLKAALFINERFMLNKNVSPKIKKHHSCSKKGFLYLISNAILYRNKKKSFVIVYYKSLHLQIRNTKYISNMSSFALYVCRYTSI